MKNRSQNRSHYSRLILDSARLMMKTSSRKYRTSGIYYKLLEKNFIPDIEAWWEDISKSIKFEDPFMEHLYVPASFAFLKQFLKKRDPELLGNAIRFNPYLLEYQDIRFQIIMWIRISRGTILTKDRGFRKYVEPFVKGLIPKAGRTPRTKHEYEKFLKDRNVNVKLTYRKLLETIQEEFEKFKKLNKRKKLFQGYRTSILKNRFKKHDPKIDHIIGKSFNEYFDDLTEEKSKPSEIALRYMRDSFNQLYGVRIGLKNLKELIK